MAEFDMTLFQRLVASGMDEGAAEFYAENPDHEDIVKGRIQYHLDQFEVEELNE